MHKNQDQANTHHDEPVDAFHIRTNLGEPDYQKWGVHNKQSNLMYLLLLLGGAHFLGGPKPRTTFSSFQGKMVNFVHVTENTIVREFR